MKPDSWSLRRRSLLPLPPGRATGAPFFRPKVLYNTQTRLFVLFFNGPSAGTVRTQGVATSRTPDGPFIEPRALNLTYSISGDFGVFADDDGRGYIVYTSYECDAKNLTKDPCRSQIIELLTDDFLSSTGISSGLFWLNSEAPWMGKVGSTYYLLFDHTCCFCSQGSGALVHTSASPLGPYQNQSNINRNASGGIIVPAQQAYVASLPGPNNTTNYVWIGDRWNSASDGQKSHDLSFMYPLEFHGPRVSPLRWVDNFTLKLAIKPERLEVPPESDENR